MRVLDRGILASDVCVVIVRYPMHFGQRMNESEDIETKRTRTNTELVRVEA